MLRNLLKTRGAASTLHFNLTFQRTGSMLSRLALASLHPHGFSSRSLTSAAVQRAATWRRNQGFPHQIPAHRYLHTLKRVSCSSSRPSPTPPPSYSACPSPWSLCSNFLSLIWPPCCISLLCIPDISAAPESLSAVSHIGVAPRGEVVLLQSCVKKLCSDNDT